MSIPYSENLSWSNFNDDRYWYLTLADQSAENKQEYQGKRAMDDICDQVVNQLANRAEQFLRDAARLIIKTPFRCIYKPIVEKCIWRQYERTGINGKLALYSFVQLISVPAKFMVALTAISISSLSERTAKWLLDKSENWTKHIDGRGSKLEALKEEGLKNAQSKKAFYAYKRWIEQISSQLCLKQTFAIELINRDSRNLSDIKDIGNRDIN